MSNSQIDAEVEMNCSMYLLMAIDIYYIVSFALTLLVQLKSIRERNSINWKNT